jgi:F-type H+-transporting ATPase subunit alpha
MDDVPADKAADFEADFHRYMETAHMDVINAIIDKKQLDDDLTAALVAAITEFKKTVSY